MRGVLVSSIISVRTACFAVPPSTFLPFASRIQTFMPPHEQHGILSTQKSQPIHLLPLYRQSIPSRNAIYRLQCSTSSSPSQQDDGAGYSAGLVHRATLHWIKKVIIGLKLCPWANAILDDGGIKLVVSEAETEDDLMDELVAEMKSLASIPVNGPNATTLLVTDKLLKNFFDYNDFAGEADEVLDDLNLRGILQLATFHPEYQFGGTSKSDPSNWTNRSPFPTFHLLREHEVTKAIEGYPDTDKIWQRNEKVMRNKGSKKMEDLLEHCKKEAEIERDSRSI